MIILFVLLYILAKTTKERDKASMESARNIIIVKDHITNLPQGLLSSLRQLFPRLHY